MIAPALAEMRELAESRSLIYRLLALVFAGEPQALTLRCIRAADSRETLASLGADLGPAFFEASGENLLEDLAVEFTRLFLGPGRHLVPHESVQRGEGRYWGDHTVSVDRFYARFGYEVVEGRSFLPDHLATEFEFMGHLAAEEAKRLARGDEAGAEALRGAQRDFLQEHLLTWAPAFCTGVAAAAEEPYFARFAEIARSVLESDSEQMGMGNQGPEENGIPKERGPGYPPEEG